MVVSSWDIRHSFVQTIQAFGTIVLERLLPTFNSIEDEADEVARSKWDELGTSWDPDADPGLAAEMAFDAGLEHFEVVSELRQGFLNWSCAALYHLFEQHMLLLLRRQVLHMREEDDPGLISLQVLWSRLHEFGVNVESFKDWQSVEELRLLANAVKHAEGRSSNLLSTRRPDLFTHQNVNGQLETPSFAGRHFFLPLAGQDLFVRPSDFSEWVECLIGFLEELADNIEGVG